MSAASSLLRRRSLRVLTSLLKHRQRELEYLTATSFGSHYDFRNFATSERLAPSLSPRALVQDRKSLGASCCAYRKFATETKSPNSPPPSPFSGPISTGTKVTAVAVTVAALTWAAAYLAFDVKPDQLSKYFSRPSKEKVASFDLIAGGGQAPESHIIGHQSDGKDTGKKPPSTEATCEVPEVKPKVLEESNSMLQVMKGVPLLPKSKEDFEHEHHKIVDSGFQIKELEDVGSSPQMTVENDGLEGSPQFTREGTTADIGGNNSTNIVVFEVKEEVGQSHPDDTVTEVKEEVGQSHPQDTVINVDVKTIGSDGPSGQPNFPVDTNGQLFASTSIEDLEPDTFRKEMQETAKEKDLKEFSDKIPYNQTNGDKDEKEAVSSTDIVDDHRHVVTDSVEAVTEIAEAIQKAGFETFHPDVPNVQDVPGLADAYFLTEVDKKESEGSCVEEYGSDQFFTYAGAIEEAEKRQAESDVQFRELLLKLDEEYQQELREARKQHELQAEYASKLKKDLSVEKERWEEQARQQLHAAEERLRSELKRKEEEARRELEKMELLTQARTNAAVTAEKARQLTDTKELQIQIEALHRAYNAQSEGAKVSHTTHKLAMGAFAFEDAMTRGAPLEEEVELLRQAAGGHDELIDIALQSLPEDLLTKGTKTQIQLEREFANLQGPLRQLALIPAGQGGLLTHAVATAVAAMKVREGTGRQGVESLIATVEECLVNGQLSLAANILEQGVRGTRAELFVSDWARHVRARVIAEQALTLVQAHAIATAAGLA